MDTPELRLHELDVISVQSGGLRKLDNGSYASTLYTDSDDFGMLGGYVRVLAAQELFWHNPNASFIFCNGRSAKQIAKFGPDVPTDAEVYAEEFRKHIAEDVRGQSKGVVIPTPKILLEDTSVNTVASITKLIAMCEAHRWKRMGLVSSDYHIPRIKALCDLIFEKQKKKPVEITFLSAEVILRRLRPGVYDDEIEAAYQAPAAYERIRNEQGGLKDISAGRYHIGEFQLAPKQ